MLRCPSDVIPDLSRNLVFTIPVTRVRLEILKQVQDDRLGCLMTFPLFVIPDLSRNLVFTIPVTRVRLEILKQVQDDKILPKVGPSEGSEGLVTEYLCFFKITNKKLVDFFFIM